MDFRGLSLREDRKVEEPELNSSGVVVQGCTIQGSEIGLVYHSGFQLVYYSGFRLVY